MRSRAREVRNTIRGTFHHMRSLALTALALIGCTNAAQLQSTRAVTADFQYVNVGGFGTQNAGFFEPGSLFLWNTEENTLQFLDTVRVRQAAQRRVAVGDLRSTGISGLAVSGLPAAFAGNDGILSASISSQAEYTVSGAFREDYRNTIDGVSDYVRELINGGQNPDLILHPRDERFRLLVIRSVLRARDSSLSIGGADASDPDRIVEVALASPIGDLASVSVRSGARSTCRQQDIDASSQLPACFFSVLILDPHYEEGNPLLQFRTVEVPSDRLPAAFRGLR